MIYPGSKISVLLNLLTIKGAFDIYNNCNVAKILSFVTGIFPVNAVD